MLGVPRLVLEVVTLRVSVVVGATIPVPRTLDRSDGPQYHLGVEGEGDLDRESIRPTPESTRTRLFDLAFESLKTRD